MFEKEELREKELSEEELDAVAGGEGIGRIPSLDQIRVLIACEACGYEATVDVYTIIPKLRCPRCRATGTMKKIRTL